MYNSMYYNNFNPYITPKPALTKNLLGGISKINWGTLLNNTQKTLNVINQAIPVYYQIKPIYNNAKTMFRLLGSMSDKTNITPTNINQSNSNITENTDFSNKPIFFS